MFGHDDEYSIFIIIAERVRVSRGALLKVLSFYEILRDKYFRLVRPHGKGFPAQFRILRGRNSLCNATMFGPEAYKVLTKFGIKKIFRLVLNVTRET